MEFLKLTPEDLNKMTIKQLKDIYKNNNINIKSNLNKTNIIKSITTHINVLNQIKKYIEDKYNVTEIVYSSSNGLTFNLITSYWNVPIKIRQGWNYDNGINIHVNFKKSRKQRRGGNMTGYCYQVVNRKYTDVICYDEIKLNEIDNEFNTILTNINKDGVWCDESYYDD
jgi:hypothetical protein